MDRTGVVTLKGNPVTLVGAELTVGQKAPGFVALDSDLKEVGLDAFSGKVKMIASVPSLDTPICDLQIKRFKKRAYLFAARGSGLFKGLHWQASSTAEKKDICTILPGVDEKTIFIAPDIPPMIKKDEDDYLESSQKPIKEIDQVRFIFLSRITPVKNLRFALALLHSIKGRIRFDLFGPVQLYIELDRTLPAGRRNLLWFQNHPAGKEGFRNKRTYPEGNRTANARNRRTIQDIARGIRPA